MSESVGDRIRRMGDDLRVARRGLAEAVALAERRMAGWADAEVQLTERTKLVLRAGRMFLCRPGRDPLALADAALMDAHDVPGWILLKAARGVRDLVDPEGD